MTDGIALGSGSVAAGYGVDGCRGGWFFVALAEDQHRFGVRESLCEIVDEIPGRATILVDMPIGLPSEHNPSRACDRLARKFIGSRRSSVFSPPTRPSLEVDSYAEASRVNHRLTGKKLSRQAWCLAPKIREVDALVTTRVAGRPVLLESHPELCFAALNQGRPMVHYKKTTQGARERIELLCDYRANLASIIDEALSKLPRNRVGSDDVVDAIVLAVCAWHCRSRLAVLPESPDLDDAGLPMQMVYPRCPTDNGLGKEAP